MFRWHNSEQRVLRVIFGERSASSNTPKRPELLRVTPFILHDTAIIKGRVRGVPPGSFKTPSYSPDFSPPDYDLFPKLKERLGRFERLI